MAWMWAEAPSSSGNSVFEWLRASAPGFAALGDCVTLGKYLTSRRHSVKRG